MIASETTTHKRPNDKLITIGQRMIFNNVRYKYHIVSHKRPRNKCKTIQTRKQTTWFMYKTMNENFNMICNNKQLLNSSSRLGTGTYRIVQTLMPPLIWDSDVPAQQYEQTVKISWKGPKLSDLEQYKAENNYEKHRHDVTGYTSILHPTLKKTRI